MRRGDIVRTTTPYTVLWLNRYTTRVCVNDEVLVVTGARGMSDFYIECVRHDGTLVEVNFNDVTVIRPSSCPTTSVRT